MQAMAKRFLHNLTHTTDQRTRGPEKHEGRSHETRAETVEAAAERYLSEGKRDVKRLVMRPIRSAGRVSSLAMLAERTALAWRKNCEST